VNNKAIKHNEGGALYIVDAHPLLKNITIEHGFAEKAGGVVIYDGSCPVLINCTVTDHQSANWGSGIGLQGGAMIMIGGKLELNADAGGVLSIANTGQALLINTFIEKNQDNPVLIRNSGIGVFINTTITGNLGWSYDPAEWTIGTRNSGSVELYNSVVTGNTLQTYGTGVEFYNTIAPDIDDAPVSCNGTESLPIESPRENEHSAGYYPLTSGYTWNTSWAWSGYEIIKNYVADPADPSNVDNELLNEIKNALKVDGNGHDRFRGSSIDLGAEELQ
jgi:hypothetical protein